MSRSVKLRTRSQWRHVLRNTSSMVRPRLGRRCRPPGYECAAARRDRWGRGRLDGLLRAHRQNLQNRARRDQQEVQVEVREAEERARDEERIECELVHLGVVRQVAILRVTLPSA